MGGGQIRRSAILANVPDPQDEEIARPDFVPKLEVTDDDAPDFTRVELCESRPEAGMGRDPSYARENQLDDANGGSGIDGLEERVEPREVEVCRGSPSNSHQRCRGRRRFRRVAAHASTLW
jgi:hypothetical protein